MNNPFVTFIIPTIGRTSIQNTIQSLYNQTNINWLAIIIIDGIDIDFQCNDSRITVLKIPKIGKYNHAGKVRNYGMKYVTTKWIAFVDDDDVVTNDYVDKLKEEINITPDASVIIFRMINNKGAIGVLPEPNTDNFYKCKVGISYSIKKELIDKNFIFEPSHIEDFVLLNKIREHKYKMIISPFVTYLVESTNTNSKYNIPYKRVVIG
jgi:glycosyltransferase involved in cell wall biosynthesis